MWLYYLRTWFDDEHEVDAGLIAGLDLRSFLQP